MWIEQIAKALGIHESLIKPLFLLVISILAWFFIFLLKKTLTRRIEAKDIRYHTRKFLDLITFLVIAIMIMIAYNEKLSGISVALGVAGAGIAFALQQVIVSFAGWLSILFGGLYKTGDRIQLGGNRGDVIDISVLRTTLMETGQWADGDLYSGRMVSISNSFVFQDAVFNYSAYFPFLWDEIKITLQYNSDHKIAKETFHKIASEVTDEFIKESRNAWSLLVRKYMIEDATTKPIVTLTVNAIGVEYNIRYLMDYRKRRDTRDLIFSRILDAINSNSKALVLASAGATQVIYVTPPEKKEP